VARRIDEVGASAAAPTIRLVAMDFAVARADRWLRRARVVALVSLATGVWSSLVMPGIGLLREPSRLWIGLGAVGILTFAAAHSGALYAAVTPWLSEAARRRLLAGFIAVAVLSVPLVGPVAAGGRSGRGWAPRSSERHRCSATAGRRSWRRRRPSPWRPVWRGGPAARRLRTS